MRTIASALILLLLAACHRAPPQPVRVPPIHPSVLVDPPYPGVPQAGAKPLFKGMSPIGQTGSNNDALAGRFRATHDITLQRHDKKDLDPADVDAILRRWIESESGVTVTATSTPVPGTRVIDYTTADTVGYARYEIDAAKPQPKVRYTLTVVEHRK